MCNKNSVEVPNSRESATDPSNREAKLAGMRAISLFTGAGGLDLGCEAAGFETVATVENNELANETLKANRNSYFPRLDPMAMFQDVTTLNVKDLLDRAGLAVGEVDLVQGGPPCTPFSKSGYWLAYKRAGKDPKASLLDNFVDVVREAQPKAFLMENVFALSYKNQNAPVFNRFKAGITEAGYSFDSKVLLASDYGVPQSRQRLICVGIRNDLLDQPSLLWQLDWPKPTHSGPHETRTVHDTSLKSHVTAGDALKGLQASANPPETAEIVTGTYEEEFMAVPPGDNYLFWTEKRGHPEPRFKWRSRYWTFLLKLSPDKPSPTIQGQPGPWVGPFHWENRRLRVGELKRLMTFPDDFRVLGSRRDQQLQLGNAVPPQLGLIVAEALRKELSRLAAQSKQIAA